jgi:hypothetical protein
MRSSRPPNRSREKNPVPLASTLVRPPKMNLTQMLVTIGLVIVMAAALNASCNQLTGWNPVHSLVGDAGTDAFFVVVLVCFVLIAADVLMGGGVTFGAACGEGSAGHMVHERALKKQAKRAAKEARRAAQKTMEGMTDGQTQ